MSGGAEDGRGYDATPFLPGRRAGLAGDQEDRQGKPFVGPAGHVLDRALADAGVDPEHAYVTNAVKHFKFTVQPGRKRRVHKSPALREMTACRPWLLAELRLVAPEVVVALGATAGQALLGGRG
ncbi:hypothetical protein GT028_02245 [Streptomyces sp. SID2999]|nr:hypothetical protein [Streptomyces sp. SID2999]